MVSILRIRTKKLSKINDKSYLKYKGKMFYISNSGDICSEASPEIPQMKLC